jgi:hypothetical protein
MGHGKFSLMVLRVATAQGYRKSNTQTSRDEFFPKEKDIPGFTNIGHLAEGAQM